MAVFAPPAEELAPGDIAPLTGAEDDYDHLLELIGDRRFILLGESTHGSHEFYRERARITQRLI
jgi:erythromycin esterase-like protein